MKIPFLTVGEFVQIESYREHVTPLRVMELKKKIIA